MCENVYSIYSGDGMRLGMPRKLVTSYECSFRPFKGGDFNGSMYL